MSEPTAGNAGESDFIFGPLSTAAGRVRRARLSRAGFVHDVSRQVLAPQAGEPIVIRAQVGPELALASAELRWTAAAGPDPAQPGPPADAVRVLPMRRQRLAWDDLAWGVLEEWSATIPGQPAGTTITYAITATTTTGEHIGSPFLDPVRLAGRSLAAAELQLAELERRPPPPGPRTYALVVGREPIPDWIRAAVIYQIFVDRFAPDPGRDFADPGDLSGFFGGTLRGVLHRLDHLVALGVTCLWLTPIFPSPSHHGYDPIDPGAIEPRLGSLEDWDALVAAARARGLRLLLDYVVNHVSSEHPRFRAAQADPEDPACRWFRFRRHPGEYDCFFDVPGQPEVDSDHPEVRAYFLAHARFWLNRGCDGFRLDYAANVSHAFWSLFRQGTRAVRADAVTLGEITLPPDVMRSYVGRMDGCLDFRLLELLRDFFAHGRLAPSAFAHALGQHLDYIGADLVLPSFLDNHDMNRFLWLVGGDRRRLRLAALCQFTLPHPPILYYGTEVGLSQRAGVGRLEEARLPMPWGSGQDPELLRFFRELIAFRRRTPALLDLERHPWLLDDGRGLLGLRCGPLLLLFHNADAEVSVALPPGWAEAEPLLATAPLPPPGGDGTLRLGPWGGVVLGLRPGSPSLPAAVPAAPSPGHPAGA